MKTSEVLRSIRWERIDSTIPPENVPVLTKIDDRDGVRNEQVLTRKGSLYFCSDGMYVYYRPTHWAYDKEI
jgi:hypothetical protein